MLKEFEEKAYTNLKVSIKNRYGISLNEVNNNAQEWLLNAAKIHTSANLQRMSQKLLDDFRKNLLGPIGLELPS